MISRANLKLGELELKYMRMADGKATAEEQRDMDMKIADERGVLKELLQTKFQVKGQDLYEPWEVLELNKEEAALNERKEEGDSTMTREEQFKRENIHLAQIRGCMLPTGVWSWDSQKMIFHPSICKKAMLSLEKPKYLERKAAFDRDERMHKKILTIYNEEDEDGVKAVVRDMGGNVVTSYKAHKLPPPGKKYSLHWKQFGDEIREKQDEPDISIIDARSSDVPAVYHSYK
tara:strand:- start:1407 stop:2102 length:696 start_codon:yes stop_codon:yes gene_type:complete